jgi:hypothetical protein
MSYGTGADQLPIGIGGDAYTVNISSDSVLVSCGDRRWASDLVCRAVPMKLDEGALNLSGAEKLEELAWSGDHLSGESFVIKRALVGISGEMRYITLVYWDG